MTEELIEYRVRPVDRFIVTRFERSANGESASGCGRGEFDNYDTAYEVAYAMAKADHERKGWPVDDERIQYPRDERCSEVVRGVSSQEFTVPVAGVLDGAKDLIEVAVIGIDEAGAIQVFSSMGTPQTIALFAQAKPHIEAMRRDED